MRGRENLLSAALRVPSVAARMCPWAPRLQMYAECTHGWEVHHRHTVQPAPSGWLPTRSSASLEMPAAYGTADR